MADLLQKRYEEMLFLVAKATQEAGRKEGEVTLLAVSKNFPAADIEALYNIGCRAFGESRIPELELKVATLPEDIEWHLIGQLQSNKVRRAVKVASVIHSVDSVGLIERLERISGEEGVKPTILLEVNVSGESSKSGFSLDEIELGAKVAFETKNVQWQGLMTIAPAEASAEELDAIFGRLNSLKSELEARYSCSLPLLSMGMSDDYSIAIKNGANIVRIGSAIFGNRVYSE